MFRRRRFHRAKAHLVLSAMRHRAVELGERVTYLRFDGYADVVRVHLGDGPVGRDVQGASGSTPGSTGHVAPSLERLGLAVPGARPLPS